LDAIQRYAAVFGRPPFIERKSNDRNHISVLGFPPLKKSFWRSLWSEAHDSTVYVTVGMSGHDMAVPQAERHSCATKVELLAVCDGQIVGGPAGTEDVVAALLLLIAEYVLDKGIILGVGHTLDLQEPLTTNTAMSAFLFTPPEGIDEKRLRRCTRAQSLLNVVSISKAELDYAREVGVAALVERFQASGVRPMFDYMRRSAL
jgi:Suppressor of fused protein (SUFU)